jgi:hypothetical protein
MDEFDRETPALLHFDVYSITAGAEQLIFEHRMLYFFDGKYHDGVFYTVYSGLGEISIPTYNHKIPADTIIGYPPDRTTEGQTTPFLAGIFSFEKNPFLCYYTKSRPVEYEGVFWYKNNIFHDEDIVTRKSSGLLHQDLNIDELFGFLDFLQSRDDTPPVVQPRKYIRMRMHLQQLPVSDNADYLKFLTKLATRGLIPFDAISSYRYSKIEERNDQRIILLFDEEGYNWLKEERAVGGEVQVFGYFYEYDTTARTAFILVNFTRKEDIELMVRRKYGF